MSDHRLTVDVQEIAIIMQSIREQLNILEKIVEEALIKENKNE